ncbi:MAG TPA: DUF4350 domain-containing protein [Cytophagaceae bacterium]
MKKDLKYILVLGSVFIVFILLELAKPKPIDWRLTFSRSDKIPFGNYVLFDLLKKAAKNEKVHASYKTVYENFQEGEYAQANNYIFINHSFSPDDLDAYNLLDFVTYGGTTFIAANKFSGILADSLKVQLNDYFLSGLDSTIFDVKADSMALTFVNPSFGDARKFFYNPEAVPMYFSSFDTASTMIAATNSKGHPVLLRVKYGNGEFILSSTPLAFTNFYMLRGNNHRFASNAFSYLSDGEIIWDEYYKVGRGEQSSPLRFIISKTPLRWAYGLTLLSLILFVVFEAKRKQRAIPIIKAPENVSLEFISTVGRLYFHHGDHADLANKKIVYFLEQVRSRYHLKTNELTEEFINKLSEKSGVSRELTRKLIELIKKIQRMDQVDERTLHQLNSTIEEFNNITKH